jgi:hypothetical protein
MTAETMSYPNDSNELPRPDLSRGSAPAWQVGLLGGIGAVITIGVLVAIQQDERTAIEVGIVLVVLGIFLAIGLIAESSVVSRIAAICLVIGGIAILAVGFTGDNPLWMAGGLVIFLAGELVLLRDRIFSQSRD